jgi:hypothetical protein
LNANEQELAGFQSQFFGSPQKPSGFFFEGIPQGSPDPIGGSHKEGF